MAMQRNLGDLQVITTAYKYVLRKGHIRVLEVHGNFSENSMDGTQPNRNENQYQVFPVDHERWREDVCLLLWTLTVCESRA
jgi:hypothetical protein